MDENHDKSANGIVNLTPIWQTGQHEKANTQLPQSSVSIFPDGPRCQTLAFRLECESMGGDHWGTSVLGEGLGVC